MVYGGAALANEAAFKTLLASKSRLAEELRRITASPVRLEGLKMLESKKASAYAMTPMYVNSSSSDTPCFVRDEINLAIPFRCMPKIQ